MTLPDGVAEVWWARLADGPGRAVTLLDQVELDRLGRYRREADRTRFALGAATVRLAAGRYLDRPASAVKLDRTCPACGEPHGKVDVLDAGDLEVSVTHSGGLVGVAFARRSLGLDVEPDAPGIEELAPRILDAAERARRHELPAHEHRLELLRAWTRKEAILKATGVGLRVGMDRVVLGGEHGRTVLSAPDLGPAAGTAHIVDLQPANDHVGALAVLGGDGIRVHQQDADDLLAG